MMKKWPKWLKITLSAFGVLFVLGAIFGRSPDETPPLAAPSTTDTSTTVPATTTAAPVETYTVSGVTDAANVTLVDASGVSKVIRIAGLVVPPPDGTGCYASETVAWAGRTLLGKTITLHTEATDTVGSVILADGTDYSTVALRSGFAKSAVDGATAAMKEAENLAHKAATGLWGPPCKGNIDVPAPVVKPKPSSVNQATARPDPAPETRAPRPTTHAPAPKPEPEPVAYYKNCTAARAAGAAPLHRGEPGYRGALDRDKDGVACE